MKFQINLLCTILFLSINQYHYGKSFLNIENIDSTKITVKSANWCGFGNIMVNDSALFLFPFNWGMGIAVIDKTTMKIDTVEQFYYGSLGYLADSLTNLINSVSKDKIVALCVMEDGWTNINDNLKNAIKTLGSKEIDSLKYKVPWCLIGEKDVPEDEIVEKIRLTDNMEPFILEAEKFFVNPPATINYNEIQSDNFVIFQNYPNPFNPTTTIKYAIPEATNVTLVIYNILGQEVIRLIDEFKPAGVYQVNWNAGNLSSGIYLYRITAGKYSEVKKLILMK